MVPKPKRDITRPREGKLDGGASANVMDEYQFKALKHRSQEIKELEPSSDTLKTLKSDLRGEQAIVVEEGLEGISGFPRVIGAVDGCHVPIRTPSEYPQSESFEKSFHNPTESRAHVIIKCCSLTFMLDGQDDARVLRNSPLYQTAEHHFQGDSHLLGDSAYPLHRWLLTSFRDNGRLSRQEVNYNNKHAKARQTIERAFGLLKGRWRKIKFIEMENINECAAIVAAACVLHNFCLLADGENIDEFLDEFNGDDGDDECELPVYVPRPQAVAKRNQMAIFLNH
ncbi:uncharacterized protein [Acropora muricata]|uniref:uncharacterized protein n=1 Tax=Acropora muricata TaxID=159855 RepID=UPI0034E4F0D6